MLTSLLVFVAAVESLGPGQAPDAQAPTAKTEKTCIIILKNGEEFPVFLDSDRRQDFESSKGVYRLTLDTPWAPGEKYFADAQIKDFVAERSETREKRIQAGWEKQGFLLIQGQPVPKREVELAQRARQMAGIEDGKEHALPPPPENVSTEPDPSEATAEPAAGGVLARWGVHAAVLVVGAVLLAAVARAMIFARR
jgi:hypothetical protein